MVREGRHKEEVCFGGVLGAHGTQQKLFHELRAGGQGAGGVDTEAQRSQGVSSAPWVRPPPPPPRGTPAHALPGPHLGVGLVNSVVPVPAVPVHVVVRELCAELIPASVESKAKGVRVGAGGRPATVARHVSAGGGARREACGAAVAQQARPHVDLEVDGAGARVVGGVDCGARAADAEVGRLALAKLIRAFAPPCRDGTCRSSRANPASRHGAGAAGMHRQQSEAGRRWATGTSSGRRQGQQGQPATPQCRPVLPRLPSQRHPPPPTRRCISGSTGSPESRMQRPAGVTRAATSEHVTHTSRQGGSSCRHHPRSACRAGRHAQATRLRRRPAQPSEQATRAAPDWSQPTHSVAAVAPANGVVGALPLPAVPATAAGCRQRGWAQAGRVGSTGGLGSTRVIPFLRPATGTSKQLRQA